MQSTDTRTGLAVQLGPRGGIRCEWAPGSLMLVLPKAGDLTL